MEFIKLKQKHSNPLTFQTFEQTTPIIKTFDINKLNIEESDPDLIHVKDCQVGSSIVCQDKSGFFKVDNLFGELKTDYDRLVARTNLGIGTEQTLSWGNIQGSLVNQADLVKFITEQISVSDDNVKQAFQDQLDELNVESIITSVYYGSSPNNLSKSDRTTFITGDYTNYIYIYTPNDSTTFKVNGLEGGFINTGNTKTIESKTYYEYISTYQGLGKTKITVSYG